MRCRARDLALATTLAALGALATLAACQGSAATPTAPDAASADETGSVADAACTELAVPDGGVVHVTGTVLEASHGDASAPTPIAGAMVAVEYGGTYVPYCDMSRASPYYVFGAVTDATGAFALDAKVGALGFHAFATRYFYSRASLDSATATTVALTLEPLPADQKAPSVTGAAFDKATVAPGDRVTFSATLATWDAKDPLSDENVLVEPTRSWGLELDPPSAGKKDDFPDGVWHRAFNAPSTPGSYTYWFSSTTANCVTSDLSKFTLTVQ